MAEMISIPTFLDPNGSLSVCEKILPFEIKRLFWIYGVGDNKRGGHAHKKTKMALVCLGGSCEIFVNNGTIKACYLLDTPDQCLVLDPKDWHTMQNFSDGAVLMVVASEYYDKDDYVYEEPN